MTHSRLFASLAVCMAIASCATVPETGRNQMILISP